MSYREEWRKYRLIDITDKIGDGLHGTPKYSKDGEYFFINGSNLVDGKIQISEKTKRVDRKQFEKHKKELSDKTIFLSINGTIGNVALYNNEKCILGKSAAYFNISNEFSRDFIKYLFLNNDFQNYIKQNATGTTIKNVGLSLLRDYEFYAPENSEKRTRIASILSAFDEKIELNRQMNATLEAMAQAMFREWFIDFEFPNENGEKYKSSGGKMVDSELGEIPKGWEVKSLDKIADYLNGVAAQKYPPKDGKDNLPVIKIRELRQGVTQASNKANTEIPEKYIIRNGDVLFAWSGSLMVDFWTGGRGILNQHLFKVTSNEYPKWFYFYWTEYHLNEFIRIAESKATTMGHIKRKHLTEAKVVVPDNKNLAIFNKSFENLVSKIISNREENQELSQLRDLLLPKLMSGELKV